MGLGGPFADMTGAFMHAGMGHMGISAMPSHGGVRDAGPTLTFGPFNRIPSTISIRSEASHAPTERDAPHDDQLGKSEGDMAAARIRVKPCRFPWRHPTSESNPTVAPEPVVPKPKGKARKGRKAVANAKVKAVAAAKAPITKRPAAATIAKRPAAAPAKLDKFNIDAWMEENASRVEARNEPRRHNFLCRVHHRARKAGIQELVRGKAAKIWDSVHNVG